jgi:WD40 repeat protein
MAFSPDGRLLATADSGMDRRPGAPVVRDRGWRPALPSGTARVWDTATGRCLRTVSGHANGVECVAFSPDGRLLVTADLGRDGTVRVWDTATGRRLHTIAGYTDVAGHTYMVISAAFSPDGRLLATGDSRLTQVSTAGEPAQVRDSGNARVWDAATGRRLHTLSGRAGGIRSVTFSPDGRLLATVGYRGAKNARVWDAATGRCLLILAGYARSVRSVTFSPDGRLLATTDSSGTETIQVWDTDTGRCLYALPGSFSHGRRATFSPDGRLLATTDSGPSPIGADSETAVSVWHAATGRRLHTLAGFTKGIMQEMKFSPDGRLLVIASSERKAGHGSGANLTLTVTATAGDAR